MSIYSALHRNTPPHKPDPPKVNYDARLSVWAGGVLNNQGKATLLCDQYPDDLFVGKQDGPRWLFTLPPGTQPWGAILSVFDVPDYSPYSERCLVAHDIVDIGLEPSAPPFVPCPRDYRGNMCGVHIPGLPPIPGGASDPTLLLSWFLDRYDEYWRGVSYEFYRSIGVRDVLVSWPDSRANGSSPEQFGAFCQELKRNGFEPCAMLASKYYDPPDIEGLKRNISPVLPYLKEVVGRYGAAWEASLWMQPVQLDALVDWLAPLITPWGGRLYIHLQAGYASFDIDGPRATFAGYWNRQVGKLTGILHQRDLSWDKALYQAKLVDVLERFAGNFFCAPDSGFGHPFDLVGLEITAEDQYARGMSTAEGNTWGQTAINTPASHGPLGPVPVLGSGNGQ